MRRPVAFFLTLATLAAATMTVGLAYDYDAASPTQPTSNATATAAAADLALTPVPNGTGFDPRYHPPGIPAITPSLPRNGNQPTFTAADARAFAETHPAEFIGASGGTPTVVSVEFMTQAEAVSRINYTLGRPGDAILCVVTMQGNFFPAHGGSNGTNANASSVESGSIYRVFDGITGNALLEKGTTHIQR